jgi:hypothetical protein
MKIDTQLPSSKLTKSRDAHFLLAHKENLTQIQPCELTFLLGCPLDLLANPRAGAKRE